MYSLTKKKNRMVIVILGKTRPILGTRHDGKNIRNIV
jgi:hypothetical protein